MLIQLNTDNHIEGRDRLMTHVQERFSHDLRRFSDHITRLEVHLSDQNGGKPGTSDKQCILEARVAGLDPVAVTHHAANIDQALNGARDKLIATLSTRLGKLQK